MENIPGEAFYSSFHLVGNKLWSKFSSTLKTFIAGGWKENSGAGTFVYLHICVKKSSVRFTTSAVRDIFDLLEVVMENSTPFKHQKEMV